MGKMPLCCYLLLRENRAYTKCCSFIINWDTSPNKKKFLIGNFTGVPIVNFIPDWESETVNQSDLQTNLSEN